MNGTVIPVNQSKQEARATEPGNSVLKNISTLVHSTLSYVVLVWSDIDLHTIKKAKHTLSRCASQGIETCEAISAARD